MIVLQDKDVEEYLRLRMIADDFLNKKIREYRVMCMVQEKEGEQE